MDIVNTVIHTNPKSNIPNPKSPSHIKQPVPLLPPAPASVPLVVVKASINPKSQTEHPKSPTH
ncbi:hypothetical protein SAMN05216490_4014 [Mucilaginibacter mallensis]|uniref:Uncharacterized protein n=1 Tax=Mucilaginibacter mallensis TaxID=652787 RepID=A0A1H2BAU1_MUCMA|nr:hypothetical protein SAMN05216490_4014 [Mucilaginibacter mallensis]